MAELNKINCVTNRKNVGIGQCFPDFAAIGGAIGLPRGTVLTAAQLAALQTTFQTKVTAPMNERFFPVHKFVGVTDNSEDPVFATLGYGKQRLVRRGNYRWLFQFIEGGLCLSNSLHFLKGLDWLFYDQSETPKLFGTKKDDGTGALGLAGVNMDEFVAYDWKVNDGSNPAQYRVMFDFAPAQINEKIGYVELDFDIEDIKGLQNINLTQSGASAAGVIKIRPLAGCEGVNLYDIYTTELAAAALWTATNATTGNAITVSSVVADPNAKAFTITLSNADPDYPATAADKVIINTVPAAALAAADVVGYEGLPVTVNRG